MRYVSYKENSLLALDRQKPKNSYGFLGRRTVKIIFIDLTISPSAAILLYSKIAENMFCCGKESKETLLKTGFLRVLPTRNSVLYERIGRLENIYTFKINYWGGLRGTPLSSAGRRGWV